MSRCPSCHSPSPERYPAVQFEGEVGCCADPYHETVTPSNTPAKIAFNKMLVEGGMK